MCGYGPWFRIRFKIFTEPMKDLIDSWWYTSRLPSNSAVFLIVHWIELRFLYCIYIYIYVYIYSIIYIYIEIYIYIYLTSFNICFWGHSKLLLKKRHRPKPFFFLVGGGGVCGFRCRHLLQSPRSQLRSSRSASWRPKPGIKMTRTTWELYHL
jgi:hypothetical protein